MDDDSPERILASYGQKAIFRDPLAATLFFGAFVYFGLTWSIGNFTPGVDRVVDTTLALSEGSLIKPGMSTPPNGSYGQSILSLPFLWTFQVASTVIPLDVLVAVLWSVAVAAFGESAGRIVGQGRKGRLYGVSIAILLLTANVAAHRPLPPDRSAVVGVGAATSVAAALTGVSLYTLVRRAYTRKLGALFGAFTVLWTPMGLWAVVPLRHSLVALFAVLAANAVYETWEASEPRSSRSRAIAYILVGLTAWIHPIDGGALLIALLLVEVICGPPEIRSATVAAIALGLSMVPYFTTNLIVTGTPIGAVDYNPIDKVGGGVSAMYFVREFAGVFINRLTLATDPSVIFKVFVRSVFSRTTVEYLPVGPVNLQLGGPQLNLSVLETMPTVGFLAGGAIGAWRQFREEFSAGVQMSPLRATDVFVVAYAAVMVLAYLPEIPDSRSIMVRQLYPVFVMVPYLLVRQNFARSAVRTRWRTILRTYGITLFGGGVIFVFFAELFTGIPAQAARIHAMAMFTIGAVAIYWGIVGAVIGGNGRKTATLLGITGGVTTGFVLLASMSYLDTGRSLLPVSRLVAELIPI